MSEANQIRLNLTSVLNLPIHTYENDFTFIVNGEEYNTNRFIANLLSPKICQIQISDPSVTEFVIDTHATGNFEYFLNLINFKGNYFSESEIPFIEEILETLGNDSIEIITGDNDITITMDNVFDLIIEHEKHQHFFSKKLEREIDFISSHFHEIKEEQDKISKITKDTLNIILNNPKLQIESEDQLIHIINKLYSHDSSYSTFYEYVDFLNVTESKIIEFVNLYNMNDLTQETWRKISERFKQPIIKQNNEEINDEKCFGIPIFYNENHEFSGIINYLRMTSKESIYNEIEISCSSTLDEKSCSPQNAVLFEEKNKHFISKNKENSWICFDFKKRRVIPKNYSIRTYTCTSGGYNPKSWVIEGSNDKLDWEIIDDQINNLTLNGYNVIGTFKIDNINDKQFQYLRMRITNPNWINNYTLAINSIEFYGRLI